MAVVRAAGLQATVVMSRLRTLAKAPRMITLRQSVLSATVASGSSAGQ
jgi:hypothetical protein